MSASSRRPGVAGQVKAKVDLPEAGLLEQDPADHLLEAVPVERLLRAVLLQADPRGAVDLEQVRAALAGPAEPLAAVALPPRMRSSIPRMVKFPTRRQRARNPTT